MHTSAGTHPIDTDAVYPTLPDGLGGCCQDRAGSGIFDDLLHAPCPVVAHRIAGAPIIVIPGMSDTARNWSPQAREAPASHASFPLIYDDLRRWAAAAMGRGAAGQTLQPTALVHEAWLRLSKDANRHWRDRTHLFRAAAQTMRWILLDRVRRRQSAKGGGGAERVAVDAFSSAAPPLNERLLAVNQCLERLEIEDPESARVITLKFFWGLTTREVAAKLGISERSVERKWAYAKVSLLDLLQRETGDFSSE